MIRDSELQKKKMNKQENMLKCLLRINKFVNAFENNYVFKYLTRLKQN